MSGGTVYRAFDAAGRLLYVGCTVDVESRLRAHSDGSPWFLFHADVTLEHFDSYDDALEAEAFAILTEHPRWNMKGRSPEHPDGKASIAAAAPWLAYELEVWRRHRKAESERRQLASATRKNAMARRTLAVEIDMVRAGAFSDDDLELEDATP